MFIALTKTADKTQARPKPDAQVQTELYGNALFEALVCEFHGTALQIGGVANVVNTSMQKGQAWMLRSCRNFLPVEAAVTSVALKGWSDIGLSKLSAHAINRIYFNVADARNRTEAVINGLGVGNSPDVPIAKLQQLNVVWRQLAEDCRVAVQDLEIETRWRLNESYTANALVLAKILIDAAKGGSTCIDRMGNVILPTLPQRRREIRYSILQQCTVTVRNVTMTAVARDISRTGIGIACAGDFRLRDNIVIELKNGRRFKGRIVWIKDGKLGIQFDGSLEQSDPFLAA